MCIYFSSLCIMFANILLAKTNHMAKQIQGLGKQIPLLEVRGESGGHFCNLSHITIKMMVKPQLHRGLDVVISLTSHELPSRPLHHPTYTTASVLFGSPRTLRRCVLHSDFFVGVLSKRACKKKERKKERKKEPV